MKRRRVKITGIGPVTPAGIGRGDFASGILAPFSRIQRFEKLGDQNGPLVAAFIDRFTIGRYIDRSRVPKGVARHTQFAIAGAMLALDDAGIGEGELESSRTMIVTGSSLMDFGGISSSTDAVHAKGPQAAIPRTIFTTTNANVTESIASVLEISPRTMTLQNSCCAGIDAIGYAAAAIAAGEVDIAICGGTEAPLHKCPLLELRAAGLTPPTTEMAERLARPFDLWRTTGVVSEGACMFILECEQSPRSAYSYITGYSYSNDRAQWVCSGIADAARMAIADARIQVSDVDSISAWAPGHRLIDRGEAAALRIVFGDRLGDLAAYSIKGAIGSSLGASPAIQVATVALAHRFGSIPPTVNWQYRDPDCPLNLSREMRTIFPQVTLIDAHGVGSVNSSMILQKC
ncbi:MAG: hypothetical protein HZC55_12280 [Verrucomicrobia bacterium]|nr:hypothetical protein [Verrucomicrobiota bacterium]